MPSPHEQAKTLDTAGLRELQRPGELEDVKRYDDQSFDTITLTPKGTWQTFVGFVPCSMKAEPESLHNIVLTSAQQLEGDFVVNDEEGMENDYENEED